MKEMEKLQLLHKKNNQKSTKARHIQPQNLALTSLQQPLKSLLYRNRSLKVLFGGTSAARDHLKTQKSSNHQFNTKNGLIPTKHTKVNKQKENMHKKVSATKDEYFLQYKKRQQNFLKQKDGRVNKKGEPIGSKAIVRKDKVSQLVSEGTNTENIIYDSEIYNWQKSIKQEKIGRTKKDDLHSPRSFKIYSNDYYGDQKENQLRKQQQKGRIQHKTIKSGVLSEKKRFRSKSLNYRPRVIRNVFQMRSPKARHQPQSPPKSLMFTFGI